MQRPNNYRVQARDAERYFPVRIRIARDRLGRDHQFENMCRWLDTQIGPGRYWHAGERSPPKRSFSTSSRSPMRKPLSIGSRAAFGLLEGGPTAMPASPTRTTGDGSATCTKHDEQRRRSDHAWLLFRALGGSGAANLTHESTASRRPVLLHRSHQGQFTRQPSSGPSRCNSTMADRISSHSS